MLTLTLVLISLHPPPSKSSLQITSGLTYFCLLNCKLWLSQSEPFHAGLLPAKCQASLHHSSEASNKPKFPKLFLWSGEEREGWAVAREVTQHTADPWCLGAHGGIHGRFKQAAPTGRRDACKGWLLQIWVKAACFLQAGNSFVKRHGILNNMLDSTFVQWEILYKSYVCWTHFSALKTKRSWSEQVRSSANWRKKILLLQLKALCCFLLLNSAFWARIFRDCLAKHKKFCHSALQRTHVTSLCQSLGIRLQLVQLFGELE